AVLLLGIGGWSGLVRGSLLGAGVIDEHIKTPENVVFRSGYAPAAADVVHADRALRLYRLAGPPSEGGIGWGRSPDDYIRMAWLSAVAGRLEQAEAHIRAGIDRVAELDMPLGAGLVDGLETVIAARGGGLDRVAAAYGAALEP